MELCPAILVILCIATVQGGPSNNLVRVSRAVFNQAGVSGEVTLVQESPIDPVGIQVNLVGLDQFTENYRWSVHEYPVRTSLLNNYPCSDAELGGVYGRGNASSCVGTPEICDVGDLTSKLGPIRYNLAQQTFLDPNLNLFPTGPWSILGRSLVIDREDGPGGTFICANIEPFGRPGARLMTLRASFKNDLIQGGVIIRKPNGLELALIEADIYRADALVSEGPTYSWTLNFGPLDVNCRENTKVYGSAAYNPADFSCGTTKKRGCIIGDLTSKCGPLNFEGDRARAFCADEQLGTVNFDGLAGLIVRIGDGNRTIGCAPLKNVPPLRAVASFRGFTEVGDFVFYQDGPDDETYIKAFLTGLPMRGVPYSLRIYEGVGTESDPCNIAQLGSIYRVPGRALFTSGSGVLTRDGCILGNLEGVLPIESNQDIRSTVSSSLPLFGPFSVIGRTLALVSGTNNIVACSVIKNSCTTCTPQMFNSILGYQNLNYPVVG